MAHYDYDTCTELDCPLCLAINAKGIPASDPPVVELGYLVVDAVSKLNDKIDNIPATDLTPLQDAIDAGDVQTLADANTYSTEADDALQDYLVSLLARHAAQGDRSVLAPIKQAFDDIFAANTGTAVKDSGGNSAGKKG